MIRMELDAFPEIKKLEFDLENRNLTVFHSENNAAISEALKKLKLGSEHVITENFDGEAGIEGFDKGPDFNLVITDIRMPEADGNQVAKYMREKEEMKNIYRCCPAVGKK